MLSKIKTYALIAAIGIITLLGIYTAVQGRNLARARAEAARLSENQETLLSELDTFRNRAGNLQAQVGALTLRAEEAEALIPSYREKLRQMEIRVKDAEHVAQVQTEFAASVTATPDTVFVCTYKVSTPGRMRYTYSDPWLDAVITVRGDTVANLQITARDSLTLVAHKQRRRCLFQKRVPTRYSVESESPYTRINGIRYIEITE